MDMFLAPYRPQILSLFRIMTGLLLFHYGTSIFFGFPAGMPSVAFLQFPGWYAGIIELVLGFLLAGSLAAYFTLAPSVPPAIPVLPAQESR